MKYYEKRKHLITKIVLVVILGIIVFFAVCDCTPKSQLQEKEITFERG